MFAMFTIGRTIRCLSWSLFASRANRMYTTVQEVSKAIYFIVQFLNTRPQRHKGYIGRMRTVRANGRNGSQSFSLRSCCQAAQAISFVIYILLYVLRCIWCAYIEVLRITGSGRVAHVLPRDRRYLYCGAQGPLLVLWAQSHVLLREWWLFLLVHDQV